MLREEYIAKITEPINYGGMPILPEDLHQASERTWYQFFSTATNLPACVWFQQEAGTLYAVVLHFNVNPPTLAWFEAGTTIDALADLEELSDFVAYSSLAALPYGLPPSLPSWALPVGIGVGALALGVMVARRK